MMQVQFSAHGADPDDSLKAGAERLLRQLLMAAARDPFDAAIRHEAAEAARALGQSQAAEGIGAIAALHRGFGRDGGSGRTGDMLDRARRELTTLIAFPIEGPEENEASAATCADPVAACRALADSLDAADGADRLASSLAAARGAAAELPPGLDLRDHVEAPTERLVELLVLRDLQAFLAVNHDLMTAPLGSPRLLHAMARLDPAGLGPYGRNLATLIRTGNDLFGLVHLAARDGGKAGADDALVARWAVLFAAHARHPQSIVDALADAGLVAPLGALLDAVARRAPWRSDGEHELIWQIRDAALDCGDLPLALRAQRLSLQLRAHDAISWRVLGEILVAAGEPAAAEEALATALVLAPADRFNADRLAAFRAGDVGFAPVGGYGTPFASKRRRLARRGAVPTFPRERTVPVVA